MVAQHEETDKRPHRPLTIAAIDAAYLDLCARAPRLTARLSLARAILLSGAYMDESALVHFPHGAIYDLDRDCCTCAHAGPSLCVHQIAMRLRRLAMGLVLLGELAVSRP